MSHVKVTTTVTHKVPCWEYCNKQAGIITPSTETCRFCVKNKNSYTCVLHNEVLDTEQGGLIRKARACEKNMAGFDTTVEDENVPTIDNKKAVKIALTEFVKIRKQLSKQGYSESVVDKMAMAAVMGEL